ncbi:MAG: hypothetical protein M3N21_08595 [Actinomycetota bacterium]|nr:hypothetical protein [Actinomycetota bacterium]
MTAVLHIADVSEFQDVNWPAYDSDAVILRAHNGARADSKFDAARVAGARARCKVVGFYGYCRAGLDAAQQGHDFAMTVKAVAGGLRPGEVGICDLEEGSGDQVARADAWAAAAQAVLSGPREWVYSGLFFRNQHLAGAAEPFWEAAYQGVEPHDRHILWQHTDHEVHAGVSGPCDCSIFDGTVDDLYALITNQTGGHPVALTPADIQAVRQAVAQDLAILQHGDSGTPGGGTHPHNLDAISARVEQIAAKVGA